MIKQPLRGKTVVVTRDRAQAGGMARLFRRAGARVVLAPMIRIVPGPRKTLDGAARRCAWGDYAWVFFTSANGVRHWHGACRRIGVRKVRQGGFKIAAVGKSTSAVLRRLGWKAACVSRTPSAVALLREWKRRTPRPPPGRMRVLVVQAESPLPGLAEGLCEIEVSVDRVAAYRTIRPRGTPSGLIERLRSGGVSWVALASPSAGRNLSLFLRQANPCVDPGTVRVACIGPTSAEAARGMGFRVAAVARRQTADGLVQAVVIARPLPPRPSILYRPGSCRPRCPHRR